MEKNKNERAGRIENLAAIAFGRDPENGAAQRGWQARLARAIGVSRAAISDTLPLANSAPMDRKLAAFCGDLRTQMLRDIDALDALDRSFGGHPPSRETNTDSFESFRSSTAARETVSDLIGLDIAPLKSWREYIGAVASANRDQDFIERARQMGSATSTGEYTLLLATLFSMDYVWLAKEIEEQTGRSFLACMSRTFGDHAKVVSAVMAMGE